MEETKVTTAEKAAEQPESIPESSGEKAKYTDADVDRIIQQKFARWQAEQEKKIAEAEKLAKMNEAEKAGYRIEELEKEIAGYKREKTLSEMASQARKMLRESDIPVSDGIINRLISEDAEATKEAVEDFTTMFKEALGTALKEALKGNAPKAGRTSSITREQIEAIKDPIERQRVIKDNMHLYKK